MKIIYWTFACLLLNGQVVGQKTLPTTTEDFKKLEWLENTWVRTNNKPGQSGHERWTKSSITELRGLGVTMRGNDTAYVEKLRIVIKDDNLYYVADVPENKALVYFKFTEITSNSFACENPDHDFPKKIVYQLDGIKLKATISGNAKSIDYWFVKK